MGTRNLTIAIVDGHVKIAQYGQWDGYPTGVGMSIQEFLKSTLSLDNGLEKMKCNLKYLEWFTKEDNLDDLDIKKFPQLSRDTGAEILSHVFNALVTKVVDYSSFACESLFCEYAYVLDFDKETVEVYKGFNKSPLTETDRFFYLQKEPPEDGYYPVRLFKAFSFKEYVTVDLKKLEEEM